MRKRILALAVALVAVVAAGCGSKTKATVPSEMGPPLGDDSPGGSPKGKKAKVGESSSEG